MGKKRSCQDVKVPRPLNEVENRLYGWVEEAVLAQPSVIQSDSLPEFRRNVSLMEDSGMEGDYVLEAAGPSDRVPFRADEGSPHFFYISFQTRQGRKMFDSYEDSIQEFKWHYFKVLLAPGRRAFWLDDEGNPFSWVYWNSEVKDFTIYNLESLEMAAFKFLVSLPDGLSKRSNFTCRWILDRTDAEVGKFLDDLLDVQMKKTKLDHLMAMMADPSRMAPRAILPTGWSSTTAAVAAAPVAGPTPAESSSQIPPAPTGSVAQKAKKQSAKRERPKRKRQKRKGKEDDAFDRALGEDSSWKHEVNPADVAFPEDFNFRRALDARLTSAFVRESLVKMPHEQLLGESYRYSAKSLACLQVRAEKELSAALDQIEVLKWERDSALAFLPLKEKVDNLNDQFSEKTGEHQSALDQVAQLEEDIGILKTQLESRQLSLEREQKRSEAAKKKSRWDPKGRRVYVPEDSEVAEEPLQTNVVPPEQQPEVIMQIPQPEAGGVADVGGGCPT
ncbi:hypothetical protein PIB30_022124 [Stylosanthes scabra]|uniref:Uncharacterized protein n=1 Tax=Stylosanthes scabra TaxID=79078 RepID=A0ABU6T8Y2_9FABA|nr:hypothetical protein [Stylosanthes scabra]